jgi:chemotaxis protein methyltransferase CheR
VKPASMSDDQFVAITALLRDTAGLSFDQSRRESIAFSIGGRMRVTGCADVASYLALLTAVDDRERQALLDEVTIPETHFFRNPPQIRALRTHVLPGTSVSSPPTSRHEHWPRQGRLATASALSS